MQPKIDNTKVKPFVFVLMPFHSAFDEIYQKGIKAACLSADTDCERVDEQIFVENILERIYNQIAKADIVVSEMTGRNPNVFYETGYARALNKRVILLTHNVDDIPFDLKHYPHIVHGGEIAQLKTQLEKRIRWFINNPTQEVTDVEGRLNEFWEKFWVLARELEEWKELHHLLNSLYIDFKYCHNEAKDLNAQIYEWRIWRYISSCQRVIEQCSNHWDHCKIRMDDLRDLAERLKYIDDRYDPGKQKGPRWMFELSKTQQSLERAFLDNKPRDIFDKSGDFAKLVDDHLTRADHSLKRVVEEIKDLRRGYRL